MATAGASSNRPEPSGRRGAALGAVLRELLACCRVFHIYSAQHSRIESQVDRAVEACRTLLDGSLGPLEIAVAGAHLQVEGVEDDSDVARALSTQLKLRGLRGVLLRPGLSAGELRGLVAHLAFEEGDARRNVYAPGTEGGVTAHIEPLPWVGTGAWVHGVAGEAAQAHPAMGDAVTSADGLEGGVQDGGAGGSQASAPPPPILASLAPMAAQASSPSRTNRDRLLDELLADPDEPAETNTRVFEIDVPDQNELLGEAELQAILKEGAGDLERRFTSHSPERLAIRILFRLLVLAPDEEHYWSRRDTFLRTLAAPERLFDDLVRVLARLLQDGSLWRFERAPEFVASVLDSVGSLATRVRLFTALPLRSEDAQQALRRWAAKPDALGALARVLAARVAPEVGEEAARLLAQHAARDHEAVEDWFRRDRRAALHPRVLHTLVTRAPEAAAPLCRRILERSATAVVRRVTHLLVAQGTGEALKILTDALPNRQQGRRLELIRAVARFAQPGAVQALRALLQQNNDKEMNTAEVETAASGLYVHELAEGREVLWDIVENRTGIAYRRPLRAIVEAVLQGNPA